MTRTTGKSRAEADARDTPEGFDPPYTAHQVHTLAQVLFHQLSGGMRPNRPWVPTATGTVASSPIVGPSAGIWSPSNPPPGFMPGGPPASYWYP